MNYPQRMTTKANNGDLVVWVRDYGHRGAYQPTQYPFTPDRPITHTNRAARRIRHAYAHECSQPAKKRVIAIGNNSGVTAVAPDYFAAASGVVGDDTAADFNPANY